ncbi:mannose-1-phosphate guanylyltransferase [Brevibacterium metallidurans]|uniref:Mannose-1-phosphate guanylyltransferase n=1 Tax=Brevibacterium metallidurans TaxID=1482676 RepID=A0ABN0SM50_9MICO
MNTHFHAIIPAGGSGTRLWPLSRKASPKFLHDVLGTGRSLLQSTWDRVAPLVGDDNVWVVTGESHLDQVAEQLPELCPSRIVAEPSPKDSAAAIGLATLLIAKTDPEAIVGSFSADHSITNVDEFRSVIEQACAAAETGDIVTVGIMPRNPATAYGYIKTGSLLGLPGAPTARRALAFAEKPAASTARRYVDSGRYRWNAGMFIAKASAFLEILRTEDPTLFEGLSQIAEAWDTESRDAVLAEVWPGLEKRAIDYVVAEPAAEAGRVIVIPGDFGWDDVGDFDSVVRLRQPVPGEPRGVISIGGSCDLLEVDASGVVFSEQPRTVAIVGLEDLVVVDTEDVLLIISRSHAQDVKKAVSLAGERGLDDLL